MNNKAFLVSSYFNSTLMFILSFLIIHLNNQLLTIFIAMDFSLQPTWFFSHISFYPDLMSAGVSQDARIALQMAVPSISLLLALAGQLLYLSLTMRYAWLSYFLLWWIAHGYNQFFGMLGLSPFLGGNQYFITGLLSLSFPIKLLIATANFFIMYKIGENMGKAILAKTGDYNISSISGRITYLATSTILPWITGGLLLLWLSGGFSYYTGYSFITMAIILTAALISGIKPLPKTISKQHFRNHINYVVLMVTVIFTGAYYYLTYEGISF